MPSSFFSYRATSLKDPTSVGVTQFVLDLASGDRTLDLKQMAELFKRFDYQLASSMTGDGLSVLSLNLVFCLSSNLLLYVEYISLSELIKEPRAQKGILQSLSSKITAEGLHGAYLLHRVCF